MDTFVRLKTWLAAEFKIREEIITPESTLDDLYWEKQGTPPDSMDIVELVMAFEADLKLELSGAELEDASPFVLDGDTTVQQIMDLIDKQTAERSG